MTTYRLSSSRSITYRISIKRVSEFPAHDPHSHRITKAHMYGPLSTLPSYHLLPNALSDSSQLQSPDKLMSAKPGERKALCITSQVHLMAQEAESVRGGFRETKPLDENVKITLDMLKESNLYQRLF